MLPKISLDPAKRPKGEEPIIASWKFEFQYCPNRTGVAVILLLLEFCGYFKAQLSHSFKFRMFSIDYAYQAADFLCLKVLIS